MDYESHDGRKLSYSSGDRGRLLELLGVFFVLCSSNLFLYLLGYESSGSVETEFLIADMLTRIGWCILVPLFLIRRDAFDWKLPKTGREWGKEFGWGLLLILAVLGCNIIIGLLVSKLGLDEPTRWSEPIESRAFLATFLLFTPIIGVHEELLFRVYAQTRLTQVLRSKTVLPVFIASGVFAAMHGYPLTGTIMILSFGLIMGASYQANGKIPRLVIAHTLWNVGVTVLGILWR
jgi:membrane protease YdiL (CAAX protease family)